ncbi:MAG: hypothetical protein ACQKBY_07030 [Verrucomicrobiales bacterium]
MERDLGTQPLDHLLEAWGLSNHEIVEASPEQLTHKQVQRARSGRRLTLKMEMKLARSLNFAIWGRLKDEERENYVEYFPKHLFNYHKAYDPEAADANESLYGQLAGRKMRKDFRQELGLED